MMIVKELFLYVKKNRDIKGDFMIGIIGAMQEEIAELLKYMKVENKIKRLEYLFYEGLINDHQVVLLQGGIGKVNAAIATTLMLTHYDIDYVINIGSAGGLHLNQNVGDVVISNKVAHHDVDLTVFGKEYGQISDLPLYFEPDSELLELVQKVLDKQERTSHIGLIVSGDQFISKKEQVDLIKSHFPEAVCSEMEAATVAHVCHVFQKKFIITRSLSDIYNKGDNAIQFDEYLKKASQASAQMCYDLIRRLPQ